jgi:hypothetical protein
MEEFCLENHFVFEILFVGGFPLEEASQMGFLYNKGIIYGFYLSFFSMFFSLCWYLL